MTISNDTTKRDHARAYADLVIKLVAVIAIIAYASRRDMEIGLNTAAVNELQGIASDLARGVAVSASRIDALENRVESLDRRSTR